MLPNSINTQIVSQGATIHFLLLYIQILLVKLPVKIRIPFKGKWLKEREWSNDEKNNFCNVGELMLLYIELNFMPSVEKQKFLPNLNILSHSFLSVCEKANRKKILNYLIHIIIISFKYKISNMLTFLWQPSKGWIFLLFLKSLICQDVVCMAFPPHACLPSGLYMSC